MKKSNILSEKLISVCLALACALSMAFMTSCGSEASVESPDASPSLSSEVPMSSSDERMPSVLKGISPGVLTDFFPFDPSQVTAFEHTVVYQGPTVSEHSVCLEGDDAVDAAQQLADFVVLSDESISGRTTAGGSYIRYTMWFGEETMTICYAGTFHADTLESQPLCYIDGEHYKVSKNSLDPILGSASPEEFGSDGCTRHTGLYHAIDSRLIEHVGQEKMDAFVEKYGWEEDGNIVNFVTFCEIPKDEFQRLIDEYNLNEHAEASGGPGYDADVIYSGDQDLIDAFYSATP